jgi:YidC/Oxa1 family membrane protein insertase
MEDKKLDLNSIIGFVLIFGILIWMMYQNQPTEKEIAAEKAKKELVVAADKSKQVVAKQTVITTVAATGDTLQMAKLKKSLGNFAYSATLPSAKNTVTTIENEFVRIKIANKGGYIVEAILKNFEKFKKGSGELVD